MGNSPSKNSQYAFQSTNKQSQNGNEQQQLQVSEESSNEPNDPDDSRSLPTQIKNISISKARNNNVLTTDNGADGAGSTPHPRRSPYFDMKIDMHGARAMQNISSSTESSGSAFLGSNSSSTASSSATTSSSSSLSLKHDNNGLSLSNSYLEAPGLLPLKNGSLPSSVDSASSATTSNTAGGSLPTIAEERGEQQAQQPHDHRHRHLHRHRDHDSSGATINNKKKVPSCVSSSLLKKTRIPNPRSTPPVILRKNSHDPYNADTLDVDDVIERLLHLGETRFYHSRDFPFHSWEVQLICATAREIFLDQPSLLRLQAPIKIVGDVHGQFTDLLRVLKLSGIPHDTNYLFLGDYVDRGKQSLETIILLLCYKIKYPDRFFMLRGNHESANVTKMYGFYDECKRRMSTKAWKQFVDVFNTLPFAAIVQEKIFCVHGGISPQLANMKQIEKIARPTDIPEEGWLTDLLWSDPDPAVSEWALNDRGVSYTFGKRNVYDFCSNFKFDLIIRGHMVVEDGYEFFAKKKFVTIFSAPNYCGQFQNWGAVMSVTTGMMCSFELLKPHGAKIKKK
ncbi:protein-serine/threonine phosphatase Ecym_2244 [Eremothecium cymbalariae DBVPG|uniref:Serine/threonine-protein phosphatase n=1 Tax=Eremothecium cymbalariae (strain CBS 270.75 / DBVPG 7215 / KCTC 17166 / NRRL Y-17582) TaxID=931890 RepID=G8JPN6_ERECY|nr:Hypothetical protein Ecym_2244 [Eremothecium cymbalariae DBVPG\